MPLFARALQRGSRFLEGMFKLSVTHRFQEDGLSQDRRALYICSSWSISSFSCRTSSFSLSGALSDTTNLRHIILSSRRNPWTGHVRFISVSNCFACPGIVTIKASLLQPQFAKCFRVVISASVRSTFANRLRRIIGFRALGSAMRIAYRNSRPNDVFIDAIVWPRISTGEMQDSLRSDEPNPQLFPRFSATAANSHMHNVACLGRQCKMPQVRGPLGK